MQKSGDVQKVKGIRRTSAVYEDLRKNQLEWQEINGMPTAIAPANQASENPILEIMDLSFLTRFGLKGKNVVNWLIEEGIPVPETPNTWCSLNDGGIVVRLGLNEFLIEDSVNSQIAPQLAVQCQYPPANVYPVLRQDCAIALSGIAVPDLLLQTCNINFQALDLSPHPVILTTMIGVSVTVIPNEKNHLPYYRIWCDYTYGRYLWKTLNEITGELAGKTIGRGT